MPDDRLRRSSPAATPRWPRDARIPYRVPTEAELPDRLPGVLAVVHRVFTEGHTASGGDRLVHDDLALEAIRLGRLLALMLLTEARRPARVAPDGTPVLLPDQDRSRWDGGLVAEGHEPVRRCLRRGRPGPYQLQAAIQAVHTDGAATDWHQVLALYDQLQALASLPVVALNRAVAVAEVHGAEAGLAALRGPDLPRSHLLPAVRADLLRRLGRTAEARVAYAAAIALAGNGPERVFLQRRRDELPAAAPSQEA